MSIPLTEAHRALADLHAPNLAVVILLTDPSGPLGDLHANESEATVAYLLAAVYRRARVDGLLHGKPAHEAQAMFAQRLRTTARRSADPMTFGVQICRALGLRWEQISEADRLWWRGEGKRLHPDGAVLTTWRSLARTEARISDLFTNTMLAADWLGQLRHPDRETP